MLLSIHQLFFKRATASNESHQLKRFDEVPKLQTPPILAAVLLAFSDLRRGSPTWSCRAQTAITSRLASSSAQAKSLQRNKGHDGNAFSRLSALVCSGIADYPERQSYFFAFVQLAFAAGAAQTELCIESGQCRTSGLIFSWLRGVTVLVS